MQVRKNTLYYKVNKQEVTHFKLCLTVIAMLFWCNTRWFWCRTAIFYLLVFWCRTAIFYLLVFWCRNAIFYLLVFWCRTAIFYLLVFSKCGAERGCSILYSGLKTPWPHLVNVLTQDLLTNVWPKLRVWTQPKTILWFLVLVHYQSLLVSLVIFSFEHCTCVIRLILQ
jgi:hypothetical protein